MSNWMQCSNGLQALHVMASTCRGFLGPDRSIKIITDDSDCEVAFTARKLLSLLDIEHPCGQLLRDVCLSHHEQNGSGCTTLVCMAGTWAKAIQSLLDEGIPSDGVLSYGDEVMRTCVQICRDRALDFSEDIGNLTSLQRVKRNVSHSNMPPCNMTADLCKVFENQAEIIDKHLQSYSCGMPEEQGLKQFPSSSRHDLKSAIGLDCHDDETSQYLEPSREFENDLVDSGSSLLDEAHVGAVGKGDMVCPEIHDGATYFDQGDNFRNCSQDSESSHSRAAKKGIRPSDDLDDVSWYFEDNDEDENELFDGRGFLLNDVCVRTDRKESKEVGNIQMIEKPTKKDTTDFQDTNMTKVLNLEAQSLHEAMSTDSYQGDLPEHFRQSVGIIDSHTASGRSHNQQQRDRQDLDLKCHDIIAFHAERTGSLVETGKHSTVPSTTVKDASAEMSTTTELFTKASRNGYKLEDGQKGPMAGFNHGISSRQQTDEEPWKSLLTGLSKSVTSGLPSHNSILKNSRHFQSDQSSVGMHPVENSIVQSPYIAHRETGIVHSTDSFNKASIAQVQQIAPKDENSEQLPCSIYLNAQTAPSPCSFQRDTGIVHPPCSSDLDIKIIQSPCSALTNKNFDESPCISHLDKSFVKPPCSINPSSAIDHSLSRTLATGQNIGQPPCGTHPNAGTDQSPCRQNSVSPAHKYIHPAFARSPGKINFDAFCSSGLVSSSINAHCKSTNAKPDRASSDLYSSSHRITQELCSSPENTAVKLPQREQSCSHSKLSKSRDPEENRPSGGAANPYIETFHQLCQGLSHGACLSMRFAEELSLSQVTNGLNFQEPYICTVIGPSEDYSSVVDGLVLNCDLEQVSMAAALRQKPLRMVLINGDLTDVFRHAGSKGQMDMRFAATDIMKPIKSRQEAWLERVIILIREFQVNLILVKGHVDSNLLDHCSASGILVISQVPYSALQYISDVTDTDMNIYFTDVTQDDICDGVHTDVWEAGWHTTIRKLETQRTAYVRLYGSWNLQTLIICGPSHPHVEQREERFRSSYARVKDLLRNKEVCIGGGQTEIQVMQGLEKLKDTDGDAFSSHTKTRIIEAFQEGLEEFIIWLELNRGSSTSKFDVKSAIRSSLTSSDRHFGTIDVAPNTGKTDQMCDQMCDHGRKLDQGVDCTLNHGHGQTFDCLCLDQDLSQSGKLEVEDADSCMTTNHSGEYDHAGSIGASNSRHHRCNDSSFTTHIVGYAETESTANNRECNTFNEGFCSCSQCGQNGGLREEVKGQVLDCLNSKIEAWQNAWSLLKIVLNMDMVVTTGKDQTDFDPLDDFLL